MIAAPFRQTAFRPAYDTRITEQNGPCQAKKYYPIILRVFPSFKYNLNEFDKKSGLGVAFFGVGSHLLYSNHSKIIKAC